MTQQIKTVRSNRKYAQVNTDLSFDPAILKWYGTFLGLLPEFEGVKGFSTNRNVHIPMEYILGLFGWFKDENSEMQERGVRIIMQEPNSEIQRWMMFDVFGMDNFLRLGGGREHLTPVDNHDYPHASIWELFLDGKAYYFLRMINQTVHPDDAIKTPEQLKNGGFTEDAKKVYIAALPHGNYRTVMDAWLFVQPALHCTFNFETLDWNVPDYETTNQFTLPYGYGRMLPHFEH